MFYMYFKICTGVKTKPWSVWPRVICVESYYHWSWSWRENNNTVKLDPAQVWSRVIACIWTNKNSLIYFWQNLLVQILIKLELHVTGILKILQQSVFGQGLFLLSVKITSPIFLTHNKSKNTNTVKSEWELLSAVGQINMGKSIFGKICWGEYQNHMSQAI